MKSDDSLHEPAAALLGVGAAGSLVGWKLLSAGRSEGGLKLRFENGHLPAITVVVQSDDPEVKPYKRVGSLAVSYLNLEGAPYPFDPSVGALMNIVADRVRQREGEWRALRGGA